VVHLRVVVHALGNGDTRRGVDVTGEQGVDVVLHGNISALPLFRTDETTYNTAVSGLDDERKVRGQSTASSAKSEIRRG
jgi:hypothetical protein